MFCPKAIPYRDDLTDFSVFYDEVSMYITVFTRLIDVADARQIEERLVERVSADIVKGHSLWLHSATAFELWTKQDRTE